MMFTVRDNTLRPHPVWKKPSWQFIDRRQLIGALGDFVFQ